MAFVAQPLGKVRLHVDGGMIRSDSDFHGLLRPFTGG
jgi:hypothetical protein